MATLATTIPSASSQTAVIAPGRHGDPVVSYKQLHAHVIAFQRRLADFGVGLQDAISIALPNSLEFIVAFLATTRQRAIAAPLNPAYKQQEFGFYIGDVRSVATLVPQHSYKNNAPVVLAAREQNSAVIECYLDGQEIVLDVKTKANIEDKRKQKVLRPRPEDIALVLHTSGTTGKPKAVPLSHANLAATMINIERTYNLTAKDRTLLVMPLFHVHGLLAGFLAPLSSHGSVIVPPRFSASEFWSDFVRYEANWYTAVPTIHQILLKNPMPDPVPKIRFIRSCSSPLSPKTFHELEEALKAPVLEAYAMTEGAHQMTSNPLPPAERRPGSVGLGQGVEVKILDQNGKEVTQGHEAEICIRGKNVMRGYLNNADANKSAFTQDGFFRTGDQGLQDKDGYVIITGRIKELINKGGEKISPVEIDNILAHSPAVSEAVCFAIPDELYGQDVGAAVVLKKDVEMDADKLRAWMATKLAKFKLPKRIFFTSQIPKTATGKVQRKVVANAMLKENTMKAKL